MIYNYNDKKTMIVISSSLVAGVAANVIGHLALAIGHRLDSNDLGKKILKDGSGVEHFGISKYPVIVTTVKPQRLRQFIHQARELSDILLVDYPEQMLLTGHDDELVTALALCKEEEINYLGAVIHGDSKIINNLSGHFSLWGNLSGKNPS